MPRISNLPPPAELTGLELVPMLQGGGLDAGFALPILAYGNLPSGAVAALRRPMAADTSSTSPGAPGAGRIRWDDVVPADATMLYISAIDDDGASLALALANIAVGGFVYLQGAAAADAPDTDARNSFQKWQITAVDVESTHAAVTGAIVADAGNVAAAPALELTIQAPNPSPGHDRAVVTVVASSGGTTQLDASLGDYFVTTLTEDTELQVINPPAAGTISLRISQGVGGYSVALPSGYRTQGGTALEVSAAAGARDRLVITSDDAFATADVDHGKSYA